MMTKLSSTDRAVRISQWDGIALLGICTGVYVYNWLLQYTLLPLDQCLWTAFLAGFPEVFISRIQIAELEAAPLLPDAIGAEDLDDEPAAQAA